MGKQIKPILIFTFALLMCALMFTACDERQSHVHSYGDWVTTKAATCTEDGIKERKCSCGDVQATPISKIAHSYSSWSYVKDPSYDETGLIERYCSCGCRDSVTVPRLRKKFFTLDSIVELDISNNHTKTINVTSHDDKRSIWFKIVDTNIVSCKWGEDWNNDVVQLTITGKQDGTTTVWLYLSDDGNLDEAEEKLAITVTVKGKKNPVVPPTPTDSPTVQFGSSYYKIYFLYEENGKVVNDGSARGVLDDLKATVNVKLNGTCDIELVMKGTVERVEYSKSTLCYYLYIYDSEGNLVHPRTAYFTDRLAEGEDINIYQTIRGLPYSSSYKIVLRSY